MLISRDKNVALIAVDVAEMHFTDFQANRFPIASIILIAPPVLLTTSIVDNAVVHLDFFFRRRLLADSIPVYTMYCTVITVVFLCTSAV